MSFRRFFLVRLAWALLAVLIAFSLAFPVHALVERPVVRPNSHITPSDLQPVERYFGWDEPLYERYWHFLRNFASDGSLGSSFFGEGDARTIALRSLPVTGSIVLPGLGIALALAFPFSVAWARAGPKRRRLWRLPGYLAVGVLPIWAALLLTFYLGFKLEWFPIQGYCRAINPTTECFGTAEWAKHLVLPWAAFSLFFAGVYARILRLVLTELKGSKQEGRERRRRRSILLVARVVGRDVGYAIGAAAILEVVFGIPGVGTRLVRSIALLDGPVAETVLIYASLFAIGIHFLVDVIVGALDSDLRVQWPFAVISPGK